MGILSVKSAMKALPIADENDVAILSDIDPSIENIYGKIFNAVRKAGTSYGKTVNPFDEITEDMDNFTKNILSGIFLEIMPSYKSIKSTAIAAKTKQSNMNNAADIKIASYDVLLKKIAVRMIIINNTKTSLDRTSQIISDAIDMIRYVGVDSSIILSIPSNKASILNTFSGFTPEE